MPQVRKISASAHQRLIAFRVRHSTSLLESEQAAESHPVTVLVLPRLLGAFPRLRQRGPFVTDRHRSSPFALTSGQPSTPTTTERDRLLATDILSPSLQVSTPSSRVPDQGAVTTKKGQDHHTLPDAAVIAKCASALSICPDWCYWSWSWVVVDDCFVAVMDG